MTKPIRRDRPDHRRNLRIGTSEGLLATPWTFLAVPGNFIIAALLTQYFRIDLATYGFIVSLPAWSNALQIVAIPWLSRFLTPKDLTVGLGWFNIGLWSMLAAVLGFLPTDDPRGVSLLFIIFFALSSLSHAFLGVGWTSWVRDWVPAPVRSMYFGRRNRLMALVSVAYLLLATAMFEFSERTLWPFQVLIITAVVLRYGSIIWQYGIRTASDHVDLVNRGWLEHFRVCLAAPGLLLFILFSAWVNFWLGFVGPFVPVFSFEQLKVLPSTFTALVIVGTLSAMVGWTYWGYRGRRVGPIFIIGIGLVLWEISQFLWCVITPDHTWLLVPMWIWGGFFSVAYFLGSFNLFLNLLPPHAKVAGTSLNLAITSVTAGLAPVLAGNLLAHFLATADDPLFVYRVGFFVKSCSVLLGLFILRRVKDPGHSPRNEVPGAFRTLRQLMAILGPSFLTNTSPIRRRKR